MSLYECYSVMISWFFYPRTSLLQWGAGGKYPPIITESVKYKYTMKQKMYEIIGKLKECPKCQKLMERRKRIKKPINNCYFFSEWDYCSNCKHIQHYDEFKCFDWKEIERQKSFLDSI